MRRRFVPGCSFERKMKQFVACEQCGIFLSFFRMPRLSAYFYSDCGKNGSLAKNAKKYLVNALAVTMRERN